MSHGNEITIRILGGFFIWFCIHIIIFAFPTFDGGTYILDDNYHIGGWPGRIWKNYENTGSFTLVTQIESDIEKFSVIDVYVLLKAGNEWYAINRQDHIISQFESLENLKDTLKLQRNIHFTTSRPWSRLRFFWPAVSLSIIAGICVIALLFFKEIKSFLVNCLKN